MLTSARTGAADATAARRPSRDARGLWVMVAITVLAAVVRFLFLSSQSLWFDEAQAVHEVHLSFGAMWHLWSGNEPNPPLYFVVAWPWVRIFGGGAAGIRSLSAVLGTVTVVLVYLCGAEMVSRRAGQVAALLVAVNPFLIWYSQEAREYMLLTTLSAATLLFFARARRTGARRDLAAWSVFGALTLSTAYFGAFLVAAEAIALLWARRARPELLACLLLIVVEAVWVPHLIGHANHPSQWIGQAGPLAIRARQVPVTFALGTMFKGPALSYSLLGGAIAAVVVTGLVLVGTDEAGLRAAGLAAALLGVVVLVPLLAAVAGRDYYVARALIGAWIPLAVLLGAACTGPRARIPGAIAAATLVAGFVWGGAVVQFGNPTYRRPDWKGVAAALGSSAQTRMIVAQDSTFVTAPLALYLPRVTWSGGAQDPQPDDSAPATVSELDLVGSVYQQLHLVQGIHTISRTLVSGGYAVYRLALPHPQTLSRSAAIALANTLLPVMTGAETLVQGAATSGADHRSV